MKPQRQKGVAAVELALILVPMLVLCFSVVEVGRALYYYDGLVKATRGAVRYLTQKNLNDSASYGAAVGVAKSLALCGKQTTCAATDLSVPGLVNVSQVTVTNYPNVPTGEGTASLVSVKIGDDDKNSPNAVKFKTFLPYSIGDFSFSAVTITMAWSTT